MADNKKRTYHMETLGLSPQEINLAGRLTPREREAFIGMMERSGMDERKRKDVLNRLIERLKGI